MQDIHYLKAWNEGHVAFSADLAAVVTSAGAGVHRLCEQSGVIGQAYDGEHSWAALRGQCRARLARLLTWAIPMGVLAGAALAVVAAASTPPELTPRHAVVVNVLPYVA